MESLESHWSGYFWFIQQKIDFEFEPKSKVLHPSHLAHNLQFVESFSNGNCQNWNCGKSIQLVNAHEIRRLAASFSCKKSGHINSVARPKVVVSTVWWASSLAAKHSFAIFNHRLLLGRKLNWINGSVNLICLQRDKLFVAVILKGNGCHCYYLYVA